MTSSVANATSASISVTRVAGHLGAEVTSVDLSRDLDDEVIAEIRQALLEHKVLFFRGQHLDHARHIAFGRRFGELTRRTGTKHGVFPDGFPEILTIDPNADDERYGKDFEERYRQKWVSYTAGWHSDLTPSVNPPAASILRAELVPAFGGDTHWTNLVAAYQGLSSPVRDLIDDLRAEHAFFAGCKMLESDGEDRSILAAHRKDPQISIHPVVRIHPETGEKALFVNPASTKRVVGLSPAESRQLLALLFEQMIRPEYTVRFRWAAGDVAFWDNRATAHLAAVDLNHLEVERRMHRVTILGDRPAGPGGFVSELVAGDPLLPFPR